MQLARNLGRGRGGLCLFSFKQKHKSAFCSPLSFHKRRFSRIEEVWRVVSKFSGASPTAPDFLSLPRLDMTIEIDELQGNDIGKPPTAFLLFMNLKNNIQKPYIL